MVAEDELPFINPRIDYHFIDLKKDEIGEEVAMDYLAGFLIQGKKVIYATKKYGYLVKNLVGSEVGSVS